jgi:type II secretory pathway pseudopilin PulG
MIRGLRRVQRDERGSGLVESLVASALLGIALIGLVGSLSTFAIASRDAEDLSQAQAIARAQAARIKAAPYQASGDYSAYFESLPSGFARTVTVRWWDGVSSWTSTPSAVGLQLVAETITVGGSPGAALEFVKAAR